MLMLQQWSSSESGGCHTVGSSSSGSRTMVVQSHGLQHCCSDTAAVQYTCLNPLCHCQRLHMICTLNLVVHAPG
jgi:hypothetical protein